MTPAALRPMTAADLGPIMGLEAALFGDESWSREMLAGELSQQPVSRYYLVAEVGGVIAGYAGLMAAGDQADVVTIAVSSERWGQGIGSQLLAELLAEAVRRRCTEVFLEVRADNERAQQLYRWWGFTDVGIRRGYYQPSGTDAIVMRLELAGTAPVRPPARSVVAARDGLTGSGPAGSKEGEAR